MKNGESVRVLKGDKIKGPFWGTSVGVSRWRGYHALKIRKSDGRVVLCLSHNVMPERLYIAWTQWRSSVEAWEKFLEENFNSIPKA